MGDLILQLNGLSNFSIINTPLIADLIYNKARNQIMNAKMRRSDPIQDVVNNTVLELCMFVNSNTFWIFCFEKLLF